jgi:hypothetical protein
MSNRRPVVNIIAESLSHDENIIPTPISGIRIGRRRVVNVSVNNISLLKYNNSIVSDRTYYRIKE